MKYIVGIFLFLGVLGDGFNKASRINNAVQEAKIYFQNRHYQKAAALYGYLADSLGVKDEQLQINRAHAQYLNGELKQAGKNYASLTNSPNQEVQAVALTQMGLIYFQQHNPERALYNFKKALIRDPLNDNARFNYELLRKYLASHPSPAQQPKRNAPQNPEESSKLENNAQSTAAQPSESGNAGTTNDFQNPAKNPLENRSQDNGSGNKGGAGKLDNNKLKPENNNRNNPIASGEAGNSTPGLANDLGNNANADINKNAGPENASNAEKELQTLRARLRNTNITPEKARMLLEAMRQAELQYLQQVPPKSTPKAKKSFPDW